MIKLHPTGRELAYNNSDLKRVCGTCMHFRSTKKNRAYCLDIDEYNEIDPGWLGCISHIEWYKMKAMKKGMRQVRTPLPNKMQGYNDER